MEMLAQEFIASLPKSTCVCLDTILTPEHISQLPHVLTDVTYNICQVLYQCNVVYVEIRFAPILYLKDESQIDLAIDAVLAGLMRSKEEFGIKYSIILSMVRELDMQLNECTVGAAIRYQHKGVSAIDLIGDEAVQFSDFVHLYKKARVCKIGTAVHIGHMPYVEKSDLTKFRPDRITYGPHLTQSDLKYISDWIHFIELRDPQGIEIVRNRRFVILLSSSNPALINNVYLQLWRQGVTLYELTDIACSGFRATFTQSVSDRHLPFKSRYNYSGWNYAYLSDMVARKKSIILYRPAGEESDSEESEPITKAEVDITNANSKVDNRSQYSCTAARLDLNTLDEMIKLQETISYLRWHTKHGKLTLQMEYDVMKKHDISKICDAMYQGGP